MTRQEWTFEVMNDAYLMSNNKINEGYLNDTLQLYVANEYPLYSMMKSKRTKAHSIAWAALMLDANTRLQWNGYKAECSSAQLKKWLETYGDGYETLNDTITFIFDQRLELMEGK